MTSSRLWRGVLVAAAIAACALFAVLIERDDMASRAEAVARRAEAEAAASREAQEAMTAAAALLRTRPASGSAYGSPIQNMELPSQGHDAWEYVRWVDPSYPGSKSELLRERNSLGIGPIYIAKLMVGYYVDSMPQGLPCWCTMTVVKVPQGGWAIRRDAWNLQTVHMEQLYGEELRLWQESGGQKG